MSAARVRLLLSDVDGTLVTPDKQLTTSTVRAVQTLADAGVLFAITSGRPPRGLRKFVEPLALSSPLAAFNGGVVVNGDLHVLSEHTLVDDAVAPVVAALREQDLAVWLYQGLDWFVEDGDTAHVVREAHACGFAPTVRARVDGVTRGVAKIVGVGDDPAAIERARRRVGEVAGDDVSATSSQSYYLDVTDRRANKGGVVDFLAAHFQIDPLEIATIGDMANDLSMFARSGLSIAMGNAADPVRAAATHVTLANDEDGFAHAVDTFVLASRAQA